MASDGTRPLRLLVIEIGSCGPCTPAAALLQGGAHARFAMTRVRLLQQALRRLDGERFDALVFDASRLDAPGQEAAAIARLNEHRPDLPIIVLGRDEDDMRAIPAIRAGAQDYLARGHHDAATLARRIRYAVERKRLEAAMARRALRDPLTGLANRTLFRTALDKALNRAARAGTLVAVLYLDLDRFKPINDTMGHAFGDSVLRQVARALAASLRRGDTACRVGGDEFAFILEGLEHRDGAASASRKILDVLARGIRVEGRRMSLAGSIGIALYPETAEDADALIERADAAMYVVKAEGGHGYRLFEAGGRSARTGSSRLSAQQRSAPP